MGIGKRSTRFPTHRIHRRPRESTRPDRGLNSTQHETLKCFQAGQSVEAIAAARSLATTTIEGHLATCITEGKLNDLKSLASADEFSQVRELFLTHGNAVGMRTLFDACEQKISYGKLRIITAAVAHGIEYG